LSYYGKFPADGTNTTVSTAWTDILLLVQQWLHTEENFGVWDLWIRNTGARDVTDIRFHHAMDLTTYGTYIEVPDVLANQLIPKLAAGESIKIRTFIPPGRLRIQAKTSAADGTMAVWFERSEVSYDGLLVDGLPLSPLPGSAGAVYGEKVVAPFALFEETHEQDLLPILFHTLAVNAGAMTHDDDLSAAALAVTIADTDCYLVQSKERFKFQTGKERVVEIDFMMTVGEENISSRVGLFDDNDGFFFVQDDDAASTLKFVRRSNATGAVVDTEYDQDDWNLDTLDSLGPSGVTLDVTDINRLFIRFGGDAGWVEFGFTIGGEVIIAHRVYVGNLVAFPLASWVTLPLAADILNDGGSVAVAVTYIFAWYVGTYGANAKPEGTRVSVNNGLVATALLAGAYSVLAARLKDGGNYVYGGLKPQGGTILCEDIAAYRWRLVVNAAPGGAPLAYGNDSTSGRSEWDVDNAGLAAGAPELVVASGYGRGPMRLPELNEDVLKAFCGLDPTVAADIGQIALELCAIDPMNAYLSLDYKEYM